MATQMTLWGEESPVENNAYLQEQVITYIGNKRLLLPQIDRAVCMIKEKLGKPKVRILDGFSGSGIVSRSLKRHASILHSNDLETYARITNECYLTNKSSINHQELVDYIEYLNEEVLKAPFDKGFIEELYAPADESNISARDRVFYTRDNAARLDNYRRLIGQGPGHLFSLALAPILSRASIHANTSGVFKGFYKSKETGAGCFGGSNRDALKRILGQIVAETPVLSSFDCDTLVYQKDVNDLVAQLPDVDIAYFDPPYNQHPYGSNYFMLNLIASYHRPLDLSDVSGIPKDWNRSGYNSKGRSLALIVDLVSKVRAKFVVLSFNSEGFVTKSEMEEALQKLGELSVCETIYNTFRGSRNLRDRPLHVTEYLYILEKR